MVCLLRAIPDFFYAGLVLFMQHVGNAPPRPWRREKRRTGKVTSPKLIKPFQTVAATIDHLAVYKIRHAWICCMGRRGGGPVRGRTGTPLRVQEPKSCASANSATGPDGGSVRIIAVPGSPAVSAVPFRGSHEACPHHTTVH